MSTARLRSRRRGTVFSATLLLSAGATPCSAEPVLWDDRAAETRDVAYPVGNGRLGALAFGSFPEERVLLNEETIWSRGAPMRMPENSFELLQEVRRLEATGDYQAADGYFVEHLQDDLDPDGYELVGWLGLEYRDTGPLRSMRRELDLATGVARHVYVRARHANRPDASSPPPPTT